VIPLQIASLSGMQPVKLALAGGICLWAHRNSGIECVVALSMWLSRIALVVHVGPCIFAFCLLLSCLHKVLVGIF